MYVVLAAAGLDAWLAEADDERWEALVGGMAEAEGRVVLPRFSFAHEAKLKRPLTELGMGVAFGSGADFSAMTERHVVVSDVLHKTFIEVNEEGSKAAAATAVEISDESEPLPPFEFIADRPFFFAIRDDRSGSLLFAGILRQP